MSKVISIRLTDQINEYIELTRKMRSDLVKGKRIVTISTTELIETAIIRFYNETCDYWMTENEIVYTDKDFADFLNFKLSNKTD